MASSELKRPAGQVVQEEEEDVPEKVPFGHVVQVDALVAPVEELDVPAVHSVTSEGLGKWIRHIVLGSCACVLHILHILSSHLHMLIRLCLQLTCCTSLHRNLHM